MLLALFGNIVDKLHQMFFETSSIHGKMTCLNNKHSTIDPGMHKLVMYGWIITQCNRMMQLLWIESNGSDSL